MPKRASKLAKENGLNADQEAEIREAFGLFAVHHPDHEDSKEGVLRKDDVRRCLMYVCRLTREAMRKVADQT